MMKSAACVLMVMVAMSAAAQYYDKKFDNIRVGEVIDNPRILKSYANCFLDLGRCTGMAKDLKDLTKDALRSTCMRCSPKQVELLRSVTQTLRMREPALFQRVLDKFDPTGTLRGPFNDILGLK